MAIFTEHAKHIHSSKLDIIKCKLHFFTIHFYNSKSLDFTEKETLSNLTLYKKGSFHCLAVMPNSDVITDSNRRRKNSNILSKNHDQQIHFSISSFCGDEGQGGGLTQALTQPRLTSLTL